MAADSHTRPRREPVEPFRVGYVRGVTPAKWARIWGQRRPDRPLELVRTDTDQTDVLRDGRAQMAFVRLPIDRDGLNVIPLYTELAVVVVPKDHAIAAVDEISRADLRDETVHDASGDIEETILLVAAGAGVVIVPQSIARLHARRDVTYRPVTDAPSTDIALAWPAHTADFHDRDADSVAVDDFIGVVRGRTAHSSRSAAARPASAAQKKANAKAAKAAKAAGAAKGAGAAKAASAAKGAGAAKGAKAGKHDTAGKGGKKSTAAKRPKRKS